MHIRETGTTPRSIWGQSRKNFGSKKSGTLCNTTQTDLCKLSIGKQESQEGEQQDRRPYSATGNGAGGVERGQEYGPRDALSWFDPRVVRTGEE